MDSMFLQQIEHPKEIGGAAGADQRDLLDDAMRSTEKKISQYDIENPKEWLLRRLSYTYYHHWEENNPSIMFLLENPGKIGDHVIAQIPELRDLGEHPEPLQLVEFYQQIGALWLTSSDYAFLTAQFLRMCEEAGLIEFDQQWWEYLLCGDFYDDFYMEDAAKYRIDECDVRNSCFTAFLRDEIESINPSIIFVFGTDAWQLLCDNLELDLLSSDAWTGQFKSRGLEDLQGELFRMTEPVDSMLIPSYHMSYIIRPYSDISKVSYLDNIKHGISRYQATLE